MGNLDRLGWTAGMAITSFGVRVGIRVSDPAVIDELIKHLPPGWKQTRAAWVDRLYSLLVGGPGSRPGLRRLNILYSNTRRIGRSIHLAEVLEAFESDLQIHVAERAPRRVFVHAGVVGWQGKAIVIPGRSYSGKTSLVAELVKAGATYYSDEYAVLDSTGMVHPYSRPLAIREGKGARQTRYRVEELGGVAGQKPLPVALVIVSKYKEGSRWRPRQLSAGQGALALLDNTVSIRRGPKSAFEAVHPLASNAEFVKSERGEAREVVDYILGRTIAAETS